MPQLPSEHPPPQGSKAGSTHLCKLLSNPWGEWQSMINMTIYFAGMQEVKVEVLRHIFDLAN